MTRRRQARTQRSPRPRRGAPGAAPGTLTERPGAKPSRVVLRKFGPETFQESELTSIDELPSLRDQPVCLWVEVTGLANTGLVAAIGRVFGLHVLSLEDVLDPNQRPKVEHYDGYTFVVLKVLGISTKVEVHPLYILFGDRFVVTLQDIDDSVLEPVRERLRRASGKIRARGSDYLAYALVDTVIDHYFPVIEAFDDHLEHVEDAVLEATNVDPIDLARRARQDLQIIRHAVWPVREAVTSLRRDDDPRVSDETRVYLRDCYDHVVQLQDMIEVSREIAASLLEAYISRVGQRSNEVMKVLTVIATIFIPLTFIAGLYGMNFNPQASRWNMPELDWYWGYPFALLLMIFVALGSLLYFRRKGWFGTAKRSAVKPPAEE